MKTLLIFTILTCSLGFAKGDKKMLTDAEVGANIKPDVCLTSDATVPSDFSGTLPNGDIYKDGVKTN